MDSYDIKKERPELYRPQASDFSVVEVPELQFLTVDGHGDPDSSTEYPAAIEALYSLSYAVRATAKRELERMHTVGPLEGLWSADDPTVFAAGDKGEWDWTMMISQPDWITSDVVDDSREQAQKKLDRSLANVRFGPYAEGTSAQILHIGSYDSEAPTLARLHDEYLPEHGLTFNGRHHEIYLADPRRTAPEKLRTILRQPVTRSS